MVIGASIKLFAISEYFTPDSSLYQFLSSFWTSFPATAKLASVGFMIFGCGVEMAGVTVSKAIAKWFKGKEMALAMGLEMAIARLGVFAVFRLSPYLSTYLNEAIPTVVTPVLVCTILLLIGLIAYTVFTFMDKALDRQLGSVEEEAEEQFKVSDIGKLFTSKTFLIVAGLCVLYYSAIFPFQKYGANMLQCNLGISATAASNIFRWFPIGAAIITPFLGRFLDKKGKGATMLMFGSLLLIVCHLVFAFVVPATQSAFIAYATIVILGISFALVPAALWPSVPKIIEEKLLGSAYSLIFWVQNIGLFFVPLLIGAVLETSNADNIPVQDAKAKIEAISTQADEAKIAGDTDKVEQLRAEADSVLIPYDYTTPLVIFAGFGISALLVAIYLKRYDKKKQLGLEEPNIKE
jgi:predicted MFS family arabinose efflux permease